MTRLSDTPMQVRSQRGDRQVPSTLRRLSWNLRCLWQHTGDRDAWVFMVAQPAEGQAA